MGFSGLETITKYANWIVVVQQDTVGLVFNLLVFFLFVLVILHLVFRFGQKQAHSERAIVVLTHVINYIEDLLSDARAGIPIADAQNQIVRQKYETVIQVIPPNTDKEYRKAKNDFSEKETAGNPLRLVATDVFQPEKQMAVVTALVRKSTALMQILEALRSIDATLYVGGGLIRNAVWDFLHGYSAPTPIDDIDVIYFDPLAATKEHDEQKERTLNAAMPNQRLSVKNQARMHTYNSDDQYDSLEDAVSKWPETATAMVVRLSSDGRIEVVAPHGLDDLFRLIVAPTPHFEGKTRRYRSRLRQKAWNNNWPNLKYINFE